MNNFIINGQEVETDDPIRVEYNVVYLGDQRLGVLKEKKEDSDRRLVWYLGTSVLTVFVLSALSLFLAMITA